MAKDVQTKLDNSNYELDRLIPREENYKMIILIIEQLGGKLTAKLVSLRPKLYGYLKDDLLKKKSKWYKKKLKFEDY